MAGCVFSDKDIFEARERGEIAIDPFVDSHVKGSSVDVRVGHHYFETERADDGAIYNPFDEGSVKRYFGQPKHAIPHEQYLDENQGTEKLEGIPLDHEIIVIGAGQRILAHTHEFIGVVPGVNATSMMKARSSTGRNGFSVCHDAGWGDPGYFNRWTMEIQNINRDHALPLPTGVRVGQVVFFHTGVVLNPYKSKYQRGDYEGIPTKEALVKIKRAWRPEDMLPRTYEDVIEDFQSVEGLSEGMR